MSSHGFKARVGSLIATWQRHMWYIHSLRFTFGTTPADLLPASMAAGCFPTYIFSTGRMEDSIGRTHVLTTLPQRHALFFFILWYTLFGIVMDL